MVKVRVKAVVKVTVRVMVMVKVKDMVKFKVVRFKAIVKMHNIQKG